MDKRICRAIVDIRNPDLGIGLHLVPGQIYDLDMKLAPGVQLRDCVDLGWFDQVARKPAYKPAEE